VSITFELYSFRVPYRLSVDRNDFACVVEVAENYSVLVLFVEPYGFGADVAVDVTKRVKLLQTIDELDSVVDGLDIIYGVSFF